MRRRRLVEDLRGSVSMSAGWLFADLLLVLAMLFLAANTMGVHPPPAPTPVPSATPTSAILPQLEQDFHRFQVHVDTQKLLADDKNAVDSVRRQIRSQSFLKGRSAGLILAFGSAHADCTGEHAYQIADKVYKLVHQMGKDDSTFARTVSYEPLCNLRNDLTLITVDIFLFSQR